MTAAPLDADALVALTVRYGRLQSEHGDTARRAGAYPDNPHLGKSAVETETESTRLRRAIAEALLSAGEDAPVETLLDLIDAWALGLWYWSWRTAVDDEDAGDAALPPDQQQPIDRSQINEYRERWEADLRALLDDASR